MASNIRLPNSIDRIKQTGIRDYVVYRMNKGQRLDFYTMKTNTGISMDEYKKLLVMNPAIDASRIGLMDN